MKFSIILPSYLGAYKNAASNRDTKLIRAINSVLGQKFTDWELIVVSDGCDKTMELVEPFVWEYLPKIRLIRIDKQPLWSGSVRNAGIFKAEGELIVYLDSDDQLGSNHLQVINDNFGDADWVFFNDLVWNGKEFSENHCNIEVKGQCGTSNFAHKRSMNAYWNDSSYLHDFVMIRTLQAMSSNYKVIPKGEYKVCHRFANPKFDI
jgi:glycosyltransferase involved in cell wall biosynthesis